MTKSVFFSYRLKKSVRNTWVKLMCWSIKTFHELQDYSDFENFELVTLCYGYIC